MYFNAASIVSIFGLSSSPQNGHFEGANKPFPNDHSLPQCAHFNKNPSFPLYLYLDHYNRLYHTLSNCTSIIFKLVVTIQYPLKKGLKIHEGVIRYGEKEEAIQMSEKEQIEQLKERIAFLEETVEQQQKIIERR